MQISISYILWIFCLSCAAVVVVFNGGLDAFSPADAKDALVVHMDMFIVPKVVIDAAIALIRAFHVDLLDLLSNLLVLHDPCTLLPGRPAKVSSSGNVQYLTGCLNRIAFLCIAFLDGSVQM